MMEYVYPCLVAFAASFVFCTILNVKDIKVALVASLSAGMGWLIYLVSGTFVGIVGQNLLAAVAVALFAEFISRVMKTPSTIFIIVGMLPMVPGGGIYYTMEYCIQGNTEMFISKGLQTLAVAGAIAVGVSIASAIYRFYMHTKMQIINKVNK
ncbi:MAG: threonine/serine exporter family protein [Oscillospiraceae bacterium]|nr:threonine/serine exporter family protein [Oscillospiraceae bacterium]